MKLPENAARKWTTEAILCYKSGIDCKNCRTIKNLVSINAHNCRMKYVVIELVKKFGAPQISEAQLLKEDKYE